MSNKKLYQETFSALHASEDKVMEVVNMKGTNKIRKFPAKKIIAVAACVGCLAATGVVVNASTDGALTKAVMGWFINADGETSVIEGDVSYDENGNKVATATLENGNQIKMTEDSETGDTVYEYSVTEEEAENKSFMISLDGNGDVFCRM